MSLKAAEVAIMIDFALAQLLKRGGSTVYGDALLGAGQALRQMREEMAAHDAVIPPAAMRRLRSYLDTHIMLSKQANIRITPKHHLLAHMIHRSRERGQRCPRGVRRAQASAAAGFDSKLRHNAPPLPPWGVQGWIRRVVRGVRYQ